MTFSCLDLPWSLRGVFGLGMVWLLGFEDVVFFVVITQSLTVYHKTDLACGSGLNDHSRLWFAVERSDGTWSFVVRRDAPYDVFEGDDGAADGVAAGVSESFAGVGSGRLDADGTQEGLRRRWSIMAE